jgi:large subunit ribosomal protein L3
MKGAILGKKLGMISYFAEDGAQVPCSVIEAGPCPVVQVKTVETDGYSAVKVGYREVKEQRVNKPEMGLFIKAGVKPVGNITEFREYNGDLQVGDVLTLGQFAKGDKLRITGTSKGKGFQGVVRRHHFSGVGMATHGQSDRQRHPGSIGSSSYPSRVFKGMKMAGRMGGTKITVRNLTVVDIIEDQNIILIKGSVPGAVNSVLKIIKL